MARFPDKFVVMQPVGDVNDPYKAPEYKQLYSGACRCYLRKPTALRVGSVKDSDFRIVIPDRSMPEVGENFRVCVKMHTNKNNRFWDLVGYVTDFGRYDRVCEIDFQMVKENVIYDDMPGSVINQEQRSLTSIDYDGFLLEGVSVTRDRIVLACGEPITLAVSTDKVEFNQFYAYLCRKDENGLLNVVETKSLPYRNNGYVGMIYIPTYECVTKVDDEGFEVEDEEAEKLANTYYLAVVIDRGDESEKVAEGILLPEPDYLFEFTVTGE